jgi:hypothetical protein
MSRPGLYCEFTTSVSRSPQGNSFGAAAAPGGGDGDGVPEKGDQSREGALIPRRPAPPLPAKADGGKSNQRERGRDQRPTRSASGPPGPCYSCVPLAPSCCRGCFDPMQRPPKSKRGATASAAHRGNTGRGGVRDQAAAGADGVL